MRADVSRRVILKIVAAGSAATVPAAAMAALDRPLVDPAQPSHQLAEWIDEYIGIHATRLIVCAHMMALPEDSAEAHKAEEEEDQLFQRLCRIEDSICTVPCTNTADVMLKLNFVRRFMMDNDLDWQWQHEKVLRSTFAILGAEA